MQTSVLEDGASDSRAPVPPYVVEVHSDTTNGHEQEQPSIGPVAGRISSFGFLGLVDPDAHNLTRGPHRDVQGDCQADCCSRLQVGRKPAQERRNAGE